MKLLFLHPDSWTGEYPLLTRLVQEGDEVCVLEERRGQRLTRETSEFFSEPGDRIQTLWYEPSRGLERLFTWIPDRIFRRAFDGRNLVHRMWVVLEAVRQFRPDVVLCSDGFSYAVPAALLRRLRLIRKPLLVTCIGGDVLDAPYADLGRRRTPLVRSLLGAMVRGADQLRCVSPALRDALIELGASPERISVLPSHLSVAKRVLEGIRLRKSAIARAIRARYGIPDGAPLLITLGNNFKAKGIHVMAQAWPAIRAAHPGCHWLLAGPDDPWLHSSVWPLLKGAQGLIVTGRLERGAVYEHLAAADLNVAPSLAEGLNMVVVEAAAVGTPSIVSSGAGIAAWVRDGDFGTVVAPGDASVLARAICEGLANHELRARWRAQCPDVARDFEIDRVASGLRDLARQLVQ